MDSRTVKSQKACPHCRLNKDGTMKCAKTGFKCSLDKCPYNDTYDDYDRRVNPTSTNYSSSPSYNYVEFYVDGTRNKYLESNFKNIRIENSIDSYYPTVFIDLSIDNQVFIELNLYPQKEITMMLYYAHEDKEVDKQPMIFNLVILEMNVDLPQKYFMNISDKQEINRQRTIITCIPKQGSEIMNVTVNKMWEEPGSIKDHVMDLINGIGMPSKIVDERKMNTAVVNQLIIPPMSFKNALLYIDEKYGVYDGKLFMNVNYNGTFLMWELKRKYDDYCPNCGLYTVHKMPSYDKCEATYKRPAYLALTTHDNYVTYDSMKTLCQSTDLFLPGGGKQIHVFHPKHDIATTMDNFPCNVAESHGVHPGPIDLKNLGGWLKKRIRAYVHLCGIEDSEEATGNTVEVNANTVNPAYGLNTLQLKLVRKIKPHIVMQVGKPLQLKSYAEHEKYSGADYTGKYLITKTVYEANRRQGSDGGNDTVYASCKITAIRTSMSKS